MAGLDALPLGGHLDLGLGADKRMGFVSLAIEEKLRRDVDLAAFLDAKAGMEWQSRAWNAQALAGLRLRWRGNP